MRLTRPTITIRLTILTTFLIVAGCTALTALWMQYHFSKELALSASENQFMNISDKVRQRALELDRSGASLTNMLALYQEIDVPVMANNIHPLTPLMASALTSHRQVYSMFVGYVNGNALMLLNLQDSPQSRINLQAAPEDHWALVKIFNLNDQRVKEISYLDEYLQVRIRHTEPTSYDARNRPWYKMATEQSQLIKTPTYLLSLSNLPGISYAIDSHRGAVVGIDVALSGMSGFLGRQNLSAGGEIFLFNDSGEVTAYRQQKVAQTSAKHTRLKLSEQEQTFIKRNPVIRVSNELDWPPFDFAVSGVPKGYAIDYLDIISQKTGLQFDFINGYSYNKLMEIYLANELDIMQPLFKNEQRQQLGLFSQPFMQAKVVAITREGYQAFNSMQQLDNLKVAAPVDFALSGYIKRNYGVTNILPVNSSLDGLIAVQEGRADILFEMESVSDYLMAYYFLDGLQKSRPIRALEADGEHSLHFMVHKNKPELLSILNKAIDSMSHKELALLKQEWLDAEYIAAQADNTNSLQLGLLPHRQILELAQQDEQGLQEIQIDEVNYFVLAHSLASLYGQTEYLGMMVPVEQFTEPYMRKVKYSLLITLMVMVLFIPVVFYLAYMIVKPIKALIDENDKVKDRQFDQVKPVKSRIKEIIQLSNSMVYMAGSIKQYEDAQKALMDAFIKLLAQAIDEKSPYTGAHCERVPKLGIMLATKASASQQGKFKEFSFDNEEQWREFKVAAWLHDCGKVTTPEHIVDKGSKLECIYNRIHEVRMRFEVLWRDAEITYWTQLKAAPHQQQQLQETLASKRQKLQDDFAFVAECNIGGEFIDQQSIQRLQKLAALKWVRNFDDRLGLSPAEQRELHTETQALPNIEPLLADRPEHLFKRPSVTERDEKYGFKMPPPEYKHNKGELYNLTIGRGTLTPEDRYIINEHIITTIQMLETLPLPKELSRVPEYAGGHHETLKGTGYPRKLTADQLSIPARILAIADIFEALTASDRPYKQAKTLTQSLDIMHKMSQEQHIDKELFELFLTSGVYLDYAKQFLREAQIDEVDISRYL